MQERFSLSARIPPEVVVDFFSRRIDSPISEVDTDRIRNLPHWEIKVIAPRTLSAIRFWHFHPEDPVHVGRILTNDGQSQKLGDVVRVYLDQLPYLKNRYSAFTTKVEGIRTALATGVHLPPLLIVTGRRPNSLSIVDGNFRALALMVQSITNPGTEWKIEALIGRRLYPWESLFIK